MNEANFSMNEADAIFDAFFKLADKISEVDEKRRKIAQLRGMASKTCGNCRHWMISSSCPRETTVKGRPSGPSMNATACDKFAGASYHEKAAGDLKKLLQDG